MHSINTKNNGYPMARSLVPIFLASLLSACSSGSAPGRPAPVVNAGPDQTVSERDQVTLSGEATNKVGTVVGYRWVQTGGPSVPFSDFTLPTISFTATSYQTTTELTFTLFIADKFSKVGSDDVVVTVLASVDADNDGITNDVDLDDDNDGYLDLDDAFPLDPSEWEDTDGDGTGNNSDAFPNDASEQLDTDGDGIGNNTDNDDDNDGVADGDDDFPLDDSESMDSDRDGVGDNSDAFPYDPTEQRDTDGDSIGNNEDLDDDNDGVPDAQDAFPLDPTETVDSDGDGVGDNSDDYPNDPSKQFDTDGDSVSDDMDNCINVPNPAQENSDGDSAGDACDAFPNNPAASVDDDGDGLPDAWEPGCDTSCQDSSGLELDEKLNDRDNDGFSDANDAFPDDPSEWEDSDGDGVGDNSDAFPDDPEETKDSDGDGIGDNRDPDDDNDGIEDAEPAPVSDEFTLAEAGRILFGEPSVTPTSSGGFYVTGNGKMNISDSTYQSHGRFFDSTGIPESPQILISSNSAFSESITLINGNVVSIRDNAGEDDLRGIWGTILSEDATVINSEYRLNESTLGHQIEPCASALLDGGFVVSWWSYDSGGDAFSDPVGRVLNADGSSRSGDITLSEISEPGTAITCVSGLTSGNFAGAWTTFNDSDGASVGVRLFDSSGNPLSSELQANTEERGSQYEPAIQGLTGGGFVVAWQSDGGFECCSPPELGGGDYATGKVISAQQYDNAGNKVGSEIIASSTLLAGTGWTPRIAPLPDGGYLVVWPGDLGTGQTYDVFLQRFSSTGIKIGRELMVNQETAGMQGAPDVAFLGGNKVVVVWFDSSSTTLKARLYDVSPL